MKLALGTAQFGLDYGIANTAGRVAADEAPAMIAEARSRGIDTLDTAIAYGDSERRLGEIGVVGWNVVSKLPALPDGCADVGGWVARSVDESLARLRVDTLYGLLLHRPSQLLEERGRSLYRALERVRERGLVARIGVSIYSPAELDALDAFRFDLVQAPLNLIDRRLLRSGWLHRLVERGTEVHVRSIFLQGLLLMRPRPVAFERWTPVFDAYDAWLADSGQSALEACVRYATGFPEIARVVVGVDALAQLRGIIDAASQPATGEPPSFDSDDPALVEPSRWTVSA